MTQPDQADYLKSLAAGNSNLVNSPALINGLASAGATPQQAQAVNYFHAANMAQLQSQLAAQGGAQVNFDQGTQAALNYLQAQKQQAHPQAKEGWWDQGFWHGVGRAWHDVTHNPVTDKIGQAANIVNSSIALLSQGVYDVAAGIGTWHLKAYWNNFNNNFERAMQAEGYDPNSFFSSIAYLASGHAQLEMSDLYRKYDPNQVDEAVKFAEDPHAYMQKLEQDPSLSPQDVARRVQDPTFQELVNQVLGRRASVGNWITDGTGVDNKTKVMIAGATDTALSFLADPTLMAFNGIKAFKASQVMLEGAHDYEGVRQILGVGDNIRQGAYAKQVRRGVNSLIDNTKAILQARKDGDDAAMAAAFARVRAETPGLKHLLPDFLGQNEWKYVDGKLVPDGPGMAITDMNKAAHYFASQNGMLRLFRGMPAAEVNYMPGQLSAFGAKKLRSALASNLAERGVKKDIFNLNKAAELNRIPAMANDAMDVLTGRVIEAPDEEGMFSQTRASAQLAGQLRYQQLGGSYASDSALEKVRNMTGPAAVAARFRLFAQRWGSYLPKDTVFSTSDPESVQKVFQYANMYLTRSHANLLSAAYAAGDEGVRKAILHGLGVQTMHAAGLGTTSAGREILGKAYEAFNKQRYSSLGAPYFDLDTLMERDAAVWPSQVNDRLALPSFIKLQQVAAKVGIWENTIGRAFNSTLADNMMRLVKVGWLVTGSNALRNAGEDLFGAWVRGELGDVLRAKHAAADTGVLPGRTVSSWLAGTRLGKAVSAKAGAPVARVANMYHRASAASATFDESAAKRLQYIADLGKSDLEATNDNFITGHVRDIFDRGDDVREITAAGQVPAKLRFRVDGYDEKSATGDAGAVRYAGALRMAINDNRELSQAIINHLDLKSFGPDWVAKILERDPRVQKMMRAGQYYDFSDPENPVLRKAISRSEQLESIQQLAHLQIAEMKHLLSDSSGNLNRNLLQYIGEHEAAPDETWIMHNLDDEQRPASVLGPTYAAVPREPGVTGLIAALGDASTKAYQVMVERPIARMSSMPIFLHHYGEARVFLEGLQKRMVENGYSEATAEAVMKDQAMQMAFNRTTKYIDDPTLRTSMDVIGRNFFAFSRATQAFIRRWGTQMIEDPARLRRAMMAMEAGQRTGLIYTDENGDKQIVFPGSGAAIEALMKIGSMIPGLNLAQIPGRIPDLHGKFAFLNSGLQNPMQLSLSPMVNIPFRAVANMFPQHRIAFDQVDQFFNGTQGQGQPWYSELEPTALKKFTDALNSDDRDSMMADSMRASLLNLAAAGKLPDQTATASERAQFLANVKTQTKNMLLLRAVFSLFAPTPPNSPNIEPNAAKSDWFYGVQGLHNLDAEFKKMVDDAGGDFGRASQLWAAIHPDKLFYTLPTTESTTKSATLQATQKSQQWINENLDFMQKYKTVAAYFIPAAAQQGNFDMQAYHAELELGLRQHKTTSQFFDEVSSANAAAEYYQALQNRNKAIQDDPTNASQYKASFDQWKQTFSGLHPTFAATQTDWSKAAQTAQDQLVELRRMVASGDAPAGVPLRDVANLVDAYDKFHQIVEQFQGQTYQDQQARADISNQYQSYMVSQVMRNPALAGLYQGVFHTLDSRALDPIGGGNP